MMRSVVFSILLITSAHAQDLVIGDSFLLVNSSDQQGFLTASHVEYYGPFNRLFSLVLESVPKHLGSKDNWLSLLHQKLHSGQSGRFVYSLSHSFSDPNNVVRRVRSQGAESFGKVYVAFSLAPLCNIHTDWVDTPSQYHSKMTHLITYLRKHIRFESLVLVDPFSVVSLRLDADILDKTTAIEGKSCKDFYQISTPASSLHTQALEDLQARFIPSFLCGSLLRSSREDLGRLASRLRSFREVMAEIYESVQATGVNVQLMATPKNILFEASDVSQDCLHLNPDGHQRIATKMYDEIKQ